jgi:pyruvate/2-oxoglutarate/acetoin dehydrogenase E1 component
MLYGTKGEVPDEEYLIPLGLADVKRVGKDVTIIAYSKMVLESLKAAKDLAAEGIEAEVVDLRSIKPLDVDTILRSVRKTGRVVCVSEGCRTNGVPSELISVIQEQVFDYLDAPVKRVCAADVPIPMSPTLEDAAIPSARNIAQAAKELLA